MAACQPQLEGEVQKDPKLGPQQKAKQDDDGPDPRGLPLVQKPRGNGETARRLG